MTAYPKIDNTLFAIFVAGILALGAFLITQDGQIQNYLHALGQSRIRAQMADSGAEQLISKKQDAVPVPDFEIDVAQKQTQKADEIPYDSEHSYLQR